MNNKLADLCGDWLLQNDFKNTLCEISFVPTNIAIMLRRRANVAHSSQVIREALVFKVHRHLYHSTLGSRVIQKKKYKTGKAFRPWLSGTRRYNVLSCSLFVLISHEGFLKACCKSQFPHRSVNLFVILVITKKYLTISWGSWLSRTI